MHDERNGHPVTYSYSVWCTGERELYDLVSDPHQINNLLAPLNKAGRFASFDSVNSDGKHIFPHDLRRLLHRLDALVLVLKTCQGETCTAPYKALFPSASFESTGGEVFKLEQVLEERYDAYFRRLPKVQYDRCELGYRAELEKPDWKAELAYRDDGAQFGAGALVFQAGK